MTGVNESCGSAYRLALGGLVLGASLVACGGALSSDERWNADADGEVGLPLVALDPECASEIALSAPPAPRECEELLLPGYLYTSAGEFWLGSQAARTIDIAGAGFFVSNDAETAQHAARFTRQVALSVGPDGALEDDGGHALLGHPPGALSGSCGVRLRAPLFAPPQATTRLDLRLNLDPRSYVTTFDILDPNGTSNGSTSFVAVDSLGAQHWLDLHFNHLGGSLFEYYVVSDGSEIAGGTTGTWTLLGFGNLQFSSDGALVTATTPPLAISFSGGATANQAIAISFGPDITTDGSYGYGGTTAFASVTSVWSQQQDGYVMGTGSDVRVSPSGEVTVDFDSGAFVEIGTLSLARFPNEDQLAEAADGSLRETSQSGRPQLGDPAGAGRGSLQISAD